MPRVDAVQEVGPALGAGDRLTADPVINIERHLVDVGVAGIEIGQVDKAADVAALDRVPYELEVRPADAAHAGHEFRKAGTKSPAQLACPFVLLTDAPSHPGGVELPAKPDEEEP